MGDAEGQCVARRGNKTEKDRLPTAVYNVPQSGSGDPTHAEHRASPENLSPTEQRLFDEILSLARKLDARGVPGVYGLVASVADQVTQLKDEGHSTVAALARGLDSLKQISATHTGKRLQTMRKVMSDHDEGILWAMVSLVGAIGCMIAGFAVSREFFAISIFLFVVAVVLMLPTLWDIMTER